MKNKELYNFIKIERPKFEERPAQIIQDIKMLDVEITLEEKRSNKYKQELIKELQKLKKDEIPVIPSKITLWMKIKFLFTGKWH
jgi:hypothetical protein